jgi:hypothetical protein
MANTGQMSLAATANAIVRGTLCNDLVVYHRNSNNQVVVAVQGTNNSMIVSASNTTVNGPFVVNGVSSNYPYCIYNSSTSSLFRSTNGIRTSNSYIYVPSGLYMCTLSYNMNPNASITVVQDDRSNLDFGQCIYTNTTANTIQDGVSMHVPPGIGSTHMVLSVNSNVKLVLSNISDNQILAMRRIF